MRFQRRLAGPFPPKQSLDGAPGTRTTPRPVQYSSGGPSGSVVGPAGRTLTGSWGSSHVSASAASSKVGRSSGGIPSRGGPPEVISESGTQCLAKSVFQPAVPNAGTSDAFAGEPTAELHVIARQGAVADGPGAQASARARPATRRLARTPSSVQLAPAVTVMAIT